MNKDGLGEEGIFIEPNLEGEESKVIFNGEEIPVKGKKICKKPVRHQMQKEDEGFKEKHKRNKMAEKSYCSNKEANRQSLNRNNQITKSNDENIEDEQGVKQTIVKKNASSIISEDEITPSQMKKAIVWSEILGKPVCKTRGSRKQGRR